MALHKQAFICGMCNEQNARVFNDKERLFEDLIEQVLFYIFIGVSRFLFFAIIVSTLSYPTGEIFCNFIGWNSYFVRVSFYQ